MTRSQAPAVSIQATAHPRGSGAMTERRAPRILALLRVLITVHVVAIFAQPVWAGIFLSGDYGALTVHRIGADVVAGLGLLQLGVALRYWRRTGIRWPAGICALLFFGEAAQYSAGMAGTLSLHIPLGVALVTFASFALVAFWRPSAGDVRSAQR